MSQQVKENELIWGPLEKINDLALSMLGVQHSKTRGPSDITGPSSQEAAVSGVTINVCPPCGCRSASSPAWFL